MNLLDSVVPTLTWRTFEDSGLCPGSPARGGLGPQKKRESWPMDTCSYVSACGCIPVLVMGGTSGRLGGNTTLRNAWAWDSAPG